MHTPLILFLIATVVPVFFGKIQSSPLWLCLQALALGWNTITLHGEPSLHSLGAGLEIIAVRAWLVPLLLRRSLARHTQAHLDLMPSNLFAWGVAIALIILAFKFGDGSRSDGRALMLGVIAATVMIALLILSTNDAPPAQLVALLFMENALALFESLMPEPWPLPTHAVLSALYFLTFAVGNWLVGSHAPPALADPEQMKEIP